MGQKIHPYCFRVGITQPWLSRWCADKKNFGRLLVEDQRIRKFIKSRLFFAGIARIEIERTGEEIRIILHAARPGIVIGRKGAEIDRLREELESQTGKKITLNIMEIAQPATNAQIVAEGIAEQLVKRSAHRRVMHKAIETALSAGAKGIKVICAGRLGGAEIARTERYVEGALPLQTLDAEIDYGFAEALTTYGQIGIKVWIFMGRMMGRLGRQTAKQEAAHAADA